MNKLEILKTIIEYSIKDLGEKRFFTRVYERTLTTGNAFTWSETKEGHNFWYKLDYGHDPKVLCSDIINYYTHKDSNFIDLNFFIGLV